MRNNARAGGPNHSEGGAAVVEFAIVVPILLLIVLGIIEFGFALSQQLDIRHGAREASRMIAVNQWDLNEACDRMDLATGVTISLANLGGGDPSGVGGEAEVTVDAPLNTVTGLFDAMLPAALSSNVHVRIEQPPTWGAGGPCP